MQKRKRYFTIMIVPHSEEATYSFRLPLFVGQLVVALLVIGMAAFFILAYTYRNALQDAEELRILRQANQAQQDEINTFASITQQLLDQVAQIEPGRRDFGGGGRDGRHQTGAARRGGSGSSGETSSGRGAAKRFTFRPGPGSRPGGRQPLHIAEPGSGKG